MTTETLYQPLAARRPGQVERVKICCPHCGNRVIIEKYKGAGITVSPKEVIAFVAQECGLGPVDLSKRNRERRIVNARYMAIWILRFELEWRMTVKEIAYLFRRDHTTVVHAAQAVKDWMETDPDFKERIATIINRLKAME